MGKAPTIITFNYDLVLERSLFQVLNNKIYDGYNNRFPYDGIEIKYHYGDNRNLKYKVNYVNYEGPNLKRSHGSKIMRGSSEEPIKIEILKLHGSLNFPSKSSEELEITKAVDDPFILPPLFNKLSDRNANNMWKLALERLRYTKNVIIVGYSLPKTDIYMQYFFKSALGPNINLNKIFVFDPVLYKDDKLSEDMKDRYACCFSSQFQSRINFHPGSQNSKLYGPGTFVDFVSAMKQGIFF